MFKRRILALLKYVLSLVGLLPLTGSCLYMQNPAEPPIKIARHSRVSLVLSLDRLLPLIVGCSALSLKLLPWVIDFLSVIMWDGLDLPFYAPAVDRSLRMYVGIVSSLRSVELLRIESFFPDETISTSRPCACRVKYQQSATIMIDWINLAFHYH